MGDRPIQAAVRVAAAKSRYRDEVQMVSCRAVMYFGRIAESAPPRHAYRDVRSDMRTADGMLTARAARKIAFRRATR
jgi:hypothetical protein